MVADAKTEKIIIHITLIINLNLKIMDKKELKFYEAPACEVLDFESDVALLAGSAIEGVDDPGDFNGGNDNPGF